MGQNSSMPAVLRDIANLLLPAGGGIEDASQLGSVHAELHTLYVRIIRTKLSYIDI